MSKMKPGRVCSIRINPPDCMGVADTIAKLGLNPEVMTFDQAVRVTLSSLLESARSAGLIPRRDGFEYSDLLSQFRTKPSDMAKKLEFTRLVDGTETVRAVMPDVARETRKRRYQELLLLHSDEVNHPKPEVGTPEWQEWESLCAEFAMEE